MTENEKIQQILIDVTEIKGAVAPLVKQGDDHEDRIRKIESMVYKWIGALLVIIIIINIAALLIKK